MASSISIKKGGGGRANVQGVEILHFLALLHGKTCYFVGILLNTLPIIETLISTQNL